jgi:hypothetical protein
MGVAKSWSIRCKCKPNFRLISVVGIPCCPAFSMCLLRSGFMQRYGSGTFIRLTVLHRYTLFWIWDNLAQTCIV